MHDRHDHVYPVVTPHYAHLGDVNKAKCVEPGTDRCTRHLVAIAVVQGGTVVPGIAEEMGSRRWRRTRKPVFRPVRILIATFLGNRVSHKRFQQGQRKTAQLEVYASFPAVIDRILKFSFVAG